MATVGTGVGHCGVDLDTLTKFNSFVFSDSLISSKIAFGGFHLNHLVPFGGFGPNDKIAFGQSEPNAKMTFGEIGPNGALSFEKNHQNTKFHTKCHFFPNSTPNVKEKIPNAKVPVLKTSRNPKKLPNSCCLDGIWWFFVCCDSVD